MSVELTLAAAMQLRTMLRAAGVVGMPAVRIRPAPAADGGTQRLEIVVEDRMEQGDRVLESRGIRFYLDPVVASVLGSAVVDLEGTDFVVRASPPGSS